MSSADTMAGEAGSGARARRSSSRLVEEDRLLAASAAESVPLVTLGLATLYVALAPVRLVLIPAPAGGALALIARICAVCLVLSFVDQRRNALEPSGCSHSAPCSWSPTSSPARDSHPESTTSRCSA